MTSEPKGTSISEPSIGEDHHSSSFRFIVAGMVMWISFSLGMSMFSVSPIMPLIMDAYSINRGIASLLISLIPLVHLLLAIPGSMLVSRIGTRKLIFLGALFGSAPLLSFLAVNFPLLVLTRVLYGVGLALVFPSVGPLAMHWFNSKELPVFNGLFVAALTFGMAISSFAVAPISEAVGWKAALSILGGIPLVGGFCWLALGQRAQASVESLGHLTFKSTLRIVRSRNTLLIAAADAGPYALLTAAVAWLPAFYHEVHGMSLSKAGSLMGLLSLAGAISLVSASVLVLRIRRRRPMLIVPGVIVGFAGFGSFLLAETPLVVVALLALGAASWFYVPILLTIPMELPGTDVNSVAVTFGTLMSMGSIFTMISPLTVGVTADLMGSYIPGLALFSVLALSLLIAGVMLPETGKTEPQSTDRYPSGNSVGKFNPFR